MRITAEARRQEEPVPIQFEEGGSSVQIPIAEEVTSSVKDDDVDIQIDAPTPAEGDSDSKMDVDSTTETETQEWFNYFRVDCYFTWVFKFVLSFIFSNFIV